MNRKNTAMDARPAPATRRRTGLRGPARLGVAAVAAGTVAGALFAAGPAVAATTSHHTAAATSYTFTTLDNQADPTFNQLLGINSHKVIAGYFGIGSSTHPNKGYLLDPPYGQSNYVNENFPGSFQTQVTGIDNKGNTCGFWVTKGGTNHGFVEWNGVFESFNDPKTPPVKHPVNQLLGINNNGVAVGFYNDTKGNAHAYEVNQATGVFTAIKIPGDVSTTATGINNNGDVVGFGTDAAGNTTSWLLHDGQLTTYQFPNGSDTEAFGVNSHDEIVGSYLDGSGVMHGFTLKAPLGPVSHWQSIDDPNGVGSTLVNGVNAAGDLVGFYTDSAGNTDGMLATP
jgi:probable HAF family extracellular repeat protein